MRVIQSTLPFLDVVEYRRSCSLMFGMQKALEEGTRDITETLHPNPDHRFYPDSDVVFRPEIT